MTEFRSDRVVDWARQAASGDNPALPAATVVVIRDGDPGLEVLMMRKDSKVAFGGMWVFPGGRIDEADSDGDGVVDDLDAAKVAAAREAEEEAGLTIDPGSLEWISFWIPPPQTPRRYATWFFVAPAPNTEVVIDDGEIREHRWLAPDEVLRLRDAGEVELAPPTWVTLNWLADHGRVEAAMAAARVVEPRRFETRIGFVGDDVVALWEGDAGYESGDPMAEGPRHRLWLHEGRWRYELTEG